VPQACIERALPSSIEIRRFAHTNFLANELPARDLWKAKRPGDALVFANARCGSWAAVQVSRSRRRPLSNLMGDAPPSARTWSRNRGLPPSAAPARRTALGSAGRIDTLLILMRTPHHSQSFKLSSDPLVRDISACIYLHPTLFSASETPAAHCGRQWIGAAHELAPWGVSSPEQIPRTDRRAPCSTSRGHF
jgi:hypothetical protein